MTGLMAYIYMFIAQHHGSQRDDQNEYKKGFRWCWYNDNTKKGFLKVCNGAG